MRVLKRLPVAAPVLLALSPLAASVALAQEQLEEIIVTARLRAESYTEAPAAIKAFTATEIQAAGIEKPHDFIALTPNVTIEIAPPIALRPYRAPCGPFSTSIC